MGGIIGVVSAGLGIVSAVQRSRSSQRIFDTNQQQFRLNAAQRTRDLEGLAVQRRLQEARNAATVARITRQQADDRADNNEKLEEDLARQRARFAAGGVGGGSASSRAVLQNLIADNDEDNRRAADRATEQIDLINRDTTGQNRLFDLEASSLQGRRQSNLLDAAQEFDSLGAGISIGQSVVSGLGRLSR